MTGRLTTISFWSKHFTRHHRYFHRNEAANNSPMWDGFPTPESLASQAVLDLRSRCDFADAFPYHARSFSTSSAFSSSSSSSSDSIKDHYKILGLTSNATQKEIKSAYIAKSKLYHPDNNPGDEARAQENFIRVSTAYKTLKSRRHRSEYDVELENMVRAMRNEEPLTQEQVDEKLRDRDKYGFWNTILPYGSATSGYERADEPHWKFMGRAVFYLAMGVGAVFLAMRFVEFMYGDILVKRRRAIARRERLRREMELEQKRPE